MLGRGDRIRTCDILLPKQARYRTALLPDSHFRTRHRAVLGWSGGREASPTLYLNVKRGLLSVANENRGSPALAPAG